MDKSEKNQSHKNAHCNSCNFDSSLQTSKQTTDELKKANGDEVITTFRVLNMDCADEIKAINEVLNIEGVLQVTANLMTSTVQILHSPILSDDFLRKQIETTIVRVRPDNSSHNNFQNRNRTVLVALSGLFLFAGLVFQWAKLVDFLDKVFFLASIFLGGALVLPKAFGALKRKTLDMNVLMSIAVIGALSINQFSEASAVVFLFAFSELLESLSVQRARRAIQELLKISSNTAALISRNGEVVETKVENILISQVIRVRPGESIPLDGTVVTGTSTVNQAPLTGESIPVVKTVGESVYAGTINQEGSLEIRVDREFKDTKISQVIKLVEEAQNQRAISQTFVDRFAKIYTPSVLALACLTFIIPPVLLGGSWNDWLYKALVLLVIACPCALVISTPISIVSSLTALAKHGVLVKGGAILELLGRIKALAIDKTGTLTEGNPKVQKIVKINSFSEEKILEIAGSLEAHSTHSLAQSILNLAKERNVRLHNVTQFSNITGRGVEAVIDGHTYLLGNHRFAHDVGICTPDLEKLLQSFEEHSLSVVIVGHKPHDDCVGEVISVIALGDQIRESVHNNLQKLKSAGVEKIVILSGDNQKTTSSIGNLVGVDESIGDLLPEDKAQQIEKLKDQFSIVAMVGDGINDAPAMAKSSIGIAMGFAGSDTAIETADMTLMKDDLSQIATAIIAGRRTLNIIRFNIGFALITKLLFLILSFTGYSSLWLAVAADTGAALLVILNSLRLLKIKDLN